MNSRVSNWRFEGRRPLGRRRLMSRLALIAVALLVPLGFQPLITHTPVAQAVPVDPSCNYYVFSTDDLLDSINKLRHRNNLNRLHTNTQLEIGATCPHSELLYNTSPEIGCPNVHQCPGEPDPRTRIINSGVAFRWWGENVGHWIHFPKFTNRSVRDAIRDVHEQWMAEGPGGPHYENLMNPNFTEIGLGLVRDKNYLWWTEDFIGP